MKRSNFINYESSIKEMNERLNKVNKNFSIGNGNEFDTAREVLKDAIQTGNEYAAKITIDYLKEITRSRASANFGNPKMHIMQPLLAKIFNRLEKVSEIPVPPYGMVDSNKINASFSRKKTNSDVMMLGFSSELFTYAQLICKVIATIIIAESQDTISIRTDCCERITQENINRYTEIVFNATAPLLNMSTVRAIKYPLSLMNVSYQLCDIFETFVAAHEHAHVFLEFALENNEEIRSLVAKRPKWANEAFADYLGTILCIKSLQTEGLSEELIVLGITIAMDSLSVLDLYDYILFDQKLSDNYLTFPNRTASFDTISLSETSKAIIQSVNKIFVHLWNNSIETIMELKKVYDEVDTKEEFLNSRSYLEIINPLGTTAESVDILDIFKSITQHHPDILKETIKQLLIRSIVRFKTGKDDIAIKGFEECLYAIEKIADNPKTFWFQQAIAKCFLSILSEKGNQQEKALFLLKDVQSIIMDPLKEKDIAFKEVFIEGKDKSYTSLLTLIFFELMVLADGDEDKMELIRSL